MSTTYPSLVKAAVGLDRSVQTLNTYLSKGMPRNADKTLNHDACVRWIEANISQRKELKATTGGDYSLSSRQCAEVLFWLGQSILPDTDVLQIALRAKLTRAEARAVVIDVLEYVASVFLESVEFDKRKSYARMGVDHKELSRAPEVLKKAKTKLKVPEL